MDTKFNLIKAANQLDTSVKKTDKIIRSNFQTLAEAEETSAQLLAEGVTHLLSYIANTAAGGKPLKAMHIDSVSAFLAGVEAIATALPKSQDVLRTQNTLRVLAQVGFGPDGELTTAAAPVAQLGARKPDLRDKYAKLVQDYSLSSSKGQPDGSALAQATKKLQVMIDRAMRQATAPQSAVAR
jgi:hypothetical protein